MKYLFVLCTALLAVMKVSCQSAFAKKGVKTVTDSLFFNTMIFATAAVFFSPGIRFLSSDILSYSAAYAVCTVAFQITYTLALSSGNVSIAVMFANFGTLIPVIVSCILGERPSVFRLIGIALTVCALITVAKPSKVSPSGRSLIFAVTAMLLNGAGLTVQKLLARAELSHNSSAFVASAYAFAALLGIAVYLILSLRGKRKTFRLERKPVVCAASAGLFLGTFLTLHTYAAGVVDGSFLYPAHAGCSTLLSTPVSLIFFKDRLTARQAVAFVTGLVAIVFMNW